jgi:hypothetical protein
MPLEQVAQYYSNLLMTAEDKDCTPEFIEGLRKVCEHKFWEAVWGRFDACRSAYTQNVVSDLQRNGKLGFLNTHIPPVGKKMAD